MTPVKELRAKAKEMKIPGYYKLRKIDLETEINELPELRKVAEELNIPEYMDMCSAVLKANIELLPGLREEAEELGVLYENLSYSDLLPLILEAREKRMHEEAQQEVQNLLNKTFHWPRFIFSAAFTAIIAFFIWLAYRFLLPPKPWFMEWFDKIFK